VPHVKLSPEEKARRAVERQAARAALTPEEKARKREEQRAKRTARQAEWETHGAAAAAEIVETLVGMYENAATTEPIKHLYFYDPAVRDLPRDHYLRLAERVGLEVVQGTRCQVREQVLNHIWQRWCATKAAREEADRLRQEEQRRRHDESFRRILEEGAFQRRRTERLLREYDELRQQTDPFRRALTVLGLTPPVSIDAVRTAYRKLAMQHHPDRGGDAATFSRVTDAYHLALNILTETNNV
jgi:DnaJ-domain-containing protein 1